MPEVDYSAIGDIC